jgi:hypothetical protein
MIFRRTHNWPLIGSFLMDPELYPYLTDDFAPPLEEFKINQHPDIWYVLVSDDGGGLRGLFCFFPENRICWSAHVVLMRKPKTPPEIARQIGREMVEWLWARTPCERLIASIPACNRAAVRYGLDPLGVACQQYGVNELSFRKHGRLWNQILMGRSRPASTQ